MAVELGDVQETLLIPLLGRALDAEAKQSILGDQKAVELVDALDYDFTRFRGPSLMGSVLRASIFDQYVRDFLARHPDGTVVDLGCGLSTRFDRLDNGRVRWFDLDMPDTMALRRTFFGDHDRYAMLDGSLFGEDWWDVVSGGEGPVFLLSEAVLLYFPDDEVRDVLRRWGARFPGSPVAFDTGGSLMMRNQDRNAVFDSIRARMAWVCDDPSSLESLGLKLRESRDFGRAQASVARRWPLKYRLFASAFRWAPFVTTYKLNLFDIPE
ncbi:class I SAM-dependent methyltransferase [Tsukamurella sp. 8F]|uniref:class I SAM-dependent methyltransferase n=1 Tax=unclassified Tsukamurella TaxID=2633480 RepID=UPI0023B8ECB7|nr:MULTISPECIES: class I SAM-dependent methyltransferase [unclassified Tsukamurella]MDF0528362.1 class I SAM-dependent methyltransferase [Tsukamurella sp. 8J]MDF0586187.1 class I SAM-dependent methyltransferase [Tsukamurella sp. 8F]